VNGDQQRGIARLVRVRVAERMRARGAVRPRFAAAPFTDEIFVHEIEVLARGARAPFGQRQRQRAQHVPVILGSMNEMHVLEPPRDGFGCVNQVDEHRRVHVDRFARAFRMVVARRVDEVGHGTERRELVAARGGARQIHRYHAIRRRGLGRAPAEPRHFPTRCVQALRNASSDDPRRAGDERMTMCHGC
jgi:hypothetical protein